MGIIIVLAFKRNGSLLNSGQTYVPRIRTRSSNYIGKSNWPGEDLFQGDIAEILIYNKALEAEDRESVDAYLAAKYALGSIATPDNLTWTTVETGLAGEATFTDSGLSADTHYLYRCVAVGDAGSTAGPATAAFTAPSAPTAPDAPTFSNVGSTQLQVHAAALPTGLTKLTLQQKLAADPDSNYVTISENNQTTYKVSGLTAETAYSFRFVAINPAGSTPGAGASVTTGDTNAPDAPLAPSVEGVSSSSVTLKMPAIPAGASSLSLQRATGAALVTPPASGLTMWLRADSIFGANNSPISGCKGGVRNAV